MNVYDFDKTIYNGDSTIDFYLYSLMRNPLLIGHLPAQIWGCLLYSFGKIHKTAFKERFFCFVKSIDCDAYVADFWVRNKKKIAKWYLEQLQDDDVIISASPDFLLRPICQQLGIRHLIASEVDPKTGAFTGANCYGVAKVERFREAFGEQHIHHFYSDSRSDLPLAQLAEHAFLIVKGEITPWDGVSDDKQTQ